MKSHTFWKHPTSYSYQFLPCPWTRLSEVNETSKWTFLTLWPWRLAYELDLLLVPWPRYHSTWPGKSQVCILYVCQFYRDCETNRQTDTQTEDLKTITPIKSEMWGVNIRCTMKVCKQTYSWEPVHIQNRHKGLISRSIVWKEIIICHIVSSSITCKLQWNLKSNLACTYFDRNLLYNPLHMCRYKRRHL